MVITATGANVTPGTQRGFRQRFSYRRRLLHLRGDLNSAFPHGGFRSAACRICFQAGVFQYLRRLLPEMRAALPLTGTLRYWMGHPGGCFARIQGGSISLSGTNAFIEASTVPLPSDFNFDTPVYRMCRALPEHSMSQPMPCREKDSRKSTSETRPPHDHDGAGQPSSMRRR